MTAATRGAETVVTVEFQRRDDGGTRPRLKHSGFPDEKSRRRHGEAWPKVLAHLRAPGPEDIGSKEKFPLRIKVNVFVSQGWAEMVKAVTLVMLQPSAPAREPTTWTHAPSRPSM